MGKKKKKSLADRLARMSDEERARYLQRKMDAELEEKKRKETLISTFIKNKIKKENAFARLNMAKINEYWHQLLRRMKCQEMKENIEYMKKEIEHIMVLKNRTIDLLLEELDDAEAQYSYNFNTHMLHIDEIIGAHNEYLNNMKGQYDEEVETLLKNAQQLDKHFSKVHQKNSEYLKTVIFTQGVNAVKTLRKEREDYMLRSYQTMTNNEALVESMAQQRVKVSEALWRQIALAIKKYVRQTDTKRLHMAELRRIDADSAAEIQQNQERINRQEEELREMKADFHRIQTETTDTLYYLQETLKLNRKELLHKRKRLQIENELDRRKIRLLTIKSNEILQLLENLHRKGEHLVFLANSCQKYETEKENISKWLPYNFEDQDIGPGVIATEELVQKKKEIQPQKNLPKSRRPKTSVAKPPSVFPNLQDFKSSLPKVILQTKSKSPSPTNSEDFEMPEDFAKCYQTLTDMEKFWDMFCKAKISVVELKEEKRVLAAENKKLRGYMRTVLETIAMSQTVVPRRMVKSAPVRKLVYKK